MITDDKNVKKETYISVADQKLCNYVDFEKSHYFQLIFTLKELQIKYTSKKWMIHGKERHFLFIIAK